MLKVPRPGRVKTRLARDIGSIDAVWWFRHQVCQLLRWVEDPRWRVVLAVAPDREGMLSRVWPAHFARLEQGSGDLGQRMRRVMRRAGGSVCVIGADIPAIRRAHIARAFDSLGRNDAVLGPAPDGGYWLIGLKHAQTPPSGLFDAVRWSTSHAMSDTVASLGPLRVGYVDTLRDVDTADDLR